MAAERIERNKIRDERKKQQESERKAKAEQDATDKAEKEKSDKLAAEKLVTAQKARRDAKYAARKKLGAKINPKSVSRVRGRWGVPRSGNTYARCDRPYHQSWPRLLGRG